MSVITHEGNIRHIYSTGAAAIAETIAPDGKWRLIQLRLHLSAGGAATDLTVTIDSGEAAVHDVVLQTTAMNAVADLVSTFGDGTQGVLMEDGDEVDVAYANGGSATWGLDVTVASGV